MPIFTEAILWDSGVGWEEEGKGENIGTTIIE